MIGGFACVDCRTVAIGRHRANDVFGMGHQRTLVYVIRLGLGRAVPFLFGIPATQTEA
jgi:hypothetical protein